MRNPFKTRYIQPGSSLSPDELRILRKGFVEANNAPGIVVVDMLLRIERDRTQIIIEERERLAELLRQNQGPYGPEEWGRGYHGAISDAIDIVLEGKA